MDRRVDLTVGILCVHGIGLQARGETLSQFADPIIDDLIRSLGSDESVHSVSANSVSGDNAEPATHVIDVVEIGRGAPGERAKRVIRCIFTEAHWADAFRPPAASSVALWLLTQGVWSIIRHLSAIGGATKSPRVSRFAGAMIAVPVAFLLQVVVIALWLATMTPIPSVREYFTRSLLLATGVLGDCYVLESPTKREQILSTIRASLLSLRKRGCDKTVVLAHSQGAAVALYALRSEPAESIDLFATFGSGIKKLEELRAINEGNGDLQREAFYILGGLVPASIAGVIVAVAGTDLQWWIRIGALGAPLLLVGLVSAWFTDPAALNASVKAAVRHPKDEHKLAFRRWCDWYAQDDPVPQGALPLMHGVLTSRRLHNRASILRDHTAYWQNRDEFVPDVVDQIWKETYLGTPIPRVRNLDAEARKRNRRFRVGSLLIGRWMVFTTLLFVWLKFCIDHWDSISARVPALIKTAVGIDTAQGAVAMLVGWPDLHVVGAATAILLLGHLTALLAWGLWDRWAIFSVYENSWGNSSLFWRWCASLAFWVMTIGTCWLGLRAAGGSSVLVPAREILGYLLTGGAAIALLIVTLSAAVLLLVYMIVKKGWEGG